MSEPYLVKLPHIAHDDRGWFARVASCPFEVAEENVSHSNRKGTIRGLHWQEPQQAKFVRVLSGAIIDACVRLSDGVVFVFEMSADRGDALLCPVGFAHGFCTLEPHTEVSYKVSEVYAPGAQYGIDPFDPALDIPWPVSSANAIMSEKDRAAPKLYSVRPAARPMRLDPVTMEWIDASAVAARGQAATAQTLSPPIPTLAERRPDQRQQSSRLR